VSLSDAALGELRAYRPALDEPADFDAFWAKTLAEAEAHELAPIFVASDLPGAAVEIHDTTYSGWGGDRIKAWLILPRFLDRPLPCVVEYLGYNVGRGFGLEEPIWPVLGYAHLIMDNRGHGGANYLRRGDTPDPFPDTHPSGPGLMARGVLDPEDYHFRRLFTDAVRAVDLVRSHPAIDPSRIVVHGACQGGAVAQAVAALRPHGVRAALIDRPFLTDIRQTLATTSREPTLELVRFVASQRDKADQVFRTLSYFDGLHFAARGRCEALYSTSLRDDLCPPSTTFAAYNHWQGAKDIVIWPWNRHEGGSGFQVQAHIRYLAKVL
jgi:cephalosporin-C deacetylase